MPFFDNTAWDLCDGRHTTRCPSGSPSKIEISIRYVGFSHRDPVDPDRTFHVIEVLDGLRRVIAVGLTGEYPSGQELKNTIFFVRKLSTGESRHYTGFVLSHIVIGGEPNTVLNGTSESISLDSSGRAVGRSGDDWTGNRPPA